ncbi:alpha-glucosidase [Candidatus Xianfuyuplasma coldseepsis]|uniref:Alpha-glucosidase n=1 Tax=Candidatus Xianfuyuplasma coldseepsis TaxID=2782163 RepID=A0A7L7KR01_9MOLU|nr:alpha-glucosidase [Xianfuyuplasma coldseepsis]QMS84646.1 alpha-glucosidase [Xianfuyuplasma coldseepsis]
MGHWWQEQTVYQVYPRSFNDSNHDGMGDIPGIIEKLDYLTALGIGVLWLSPVYKSPQKDNGYDIADYKDIDPLFGTMADMDQLIVEAEKRGIKIVMDLVINHNSDQHEWFQKSRQRIDPYTDYYIWRDGKDGGPPNNWTSFFAGEAWQYDDMRKQYYLHLFATEQPDLNYHNKAVIEEVKDIIKCWLDRGVHGFRCDVINIIFKSSLEDGKRQLVLKGLEHYLSQEGNHEILQELRRDVLDHYDCFTVGETVLVTPKMARDLCDPSRKELDMIFSFEHMEADQYFVKWFKRKFQKKVFFETLSKWQKELHWNANYFENHDQLRSVSRFGDDTRYWMESATMLATLLFSLKGTPFIYQGQEIGMTNFDFQSMDDIQDVESHNVYRFLGRFHLPKWLRWRMIFKSSRDNVRTPMQWSDSEYGGFSTVQPWLKVNSNYHTINVANQFHQEGTIWSYYQTLIHLRNNDQTLIYGDFEKMYIDKHVFIFRRYDEQEAYIIAVNFSTKKRTISYRGDVLISNYNTTRFNGVLQPYEAIILKG